MTGDHAMRRFTEHKPVGNPLELAEDHGAVVDGTTLFLAQIRWPGLVPRLLKSGHNNRKIGKRVVKGRWKGMPIYTLTLEERRTCPEYCANWRDCYGNKMHFSQRLMHGHALEHRLGRELRDLAEAHPQGYVVRLHVLGDFYSVAYVKRWLSWLHRIPELHVFGYTARHAVRDGIGRILRDAVKHHRDRFFIRFSNQEMAGLPSAHVVDRDDGCGIVCPAQTDKTDCCGTCALCWSTPRPIYFLTH